MTITKTDRNQLVKDFKTVFVTKDDLKNLRVDLREEIDEMMDKKFFDFKSELFTKIDPILKEVTTNREERVIINHRLSELEQAVLQ